MHPIIICFLQWLVFILFIDLNNINYSPRSTYTWKTQRHCTTSFDVSENVYNHIYSSFKIEKILDDGLDNLDKILEELSMAHVQMEKSLQVKLTKVMKKIMRYKIKNVMIVWLSKFTFVIHYTFHILCCFLIAIITGFIFGRYNRRRVT
ncbi:uncharacterized protein LOC116844565 [Odontomachus brunneus]|uniref:uncharacterized protein LOC116844565 n=1 Tax=Odontomachus brunneus TaxID=486640 RepID=UPI0013F20B03|nr:uncharacterized protein LOC116844565 [Odontomachus brunneus]XP_032672151.1 uncharacterized protein LOC116844565 [Odontomachus brunneus]